MDARIKNNPAIGFNESNIHPAQLSISYPLWFGLNEQQLFQPTGGLMTPKVKPNDQLCQDATQLWVQLKDKSSQSSQSPVQSNQEEADSGRSNSRLSSESGQTQSHSKPSESQAKAFPGTTDIALNPRHMEMEYSQPVAHNLYPYGLPQFGQFLNAYGAHNRMMELTPSRVPLPFNIADEGPIYVNAKQYNGIMRRRQSRAKLEAQNKLVKARKAYLHESRHQHALNRVRGAGGRFLSKNKLQHTIDTHSHSNSGSISVHQTVKMFDYKVQQQGLANVPNEAMYRQPDIRYSSGMLGDAPIQDSSFSCENKQCASIVR